MFGFKVLGDIEGVTGWKKSRAIRLERDKKIKHVLKSYRNADEYVYVNVNDELLQPVRVKLPPCPDWRRIDGYGMKKEDQVFTRQVYPHRLERLEADAKKSVAMKYSSRRGKVSHRSIEKEIEEHVWGALKNQPGKYRDEIEWIRKQWSYRMYGYWFFNNGKPTFIDGWHFVYLNYWSLEGVGLPDYWDRDRDWFVFVRFCLEDTTRPVYREVKNDAGDVIRKDLVYDDAGFLALEDTGSRVCFGVNVNKGRRVGDTSKAQCINYCIVSCMLEVNTGIQGNDGETAEKAFLEKLVNGFRSSHMKFFFKPVTQNSNPRNELIFDVDYGDDGLRSKADFASTANRTFYDSRRMLYVHQDEVGKTILENIDKRQEVLRRCLQEGKKIIGLMVNTTTVEDTGQDAIRMFLKLTEKSHYQDRDINGRTASGVYNLFFPAYHGYKGFIDRYGFSIIDTPVGYQIEDLKREHGMVPMNDRGEYIGCREFLENERQALLDRDDIEGYTSIKRLHPFEFRDCFTPPARNQIFNVNKLERRYNELCFGSTKKMARRGYFKWSAGFGSDVEWVDKSDASDDVEGLKRFSLYYMPSDGLRNRKINHDGVYRPEFGEVYIASADAFRLENVRGARMSNGGGAVRMKRDLAIDPSEKEVSEWETAKYVLTYNYRPKTKESYAEDMLMMCIFYGAMMYPEMNVPLIDEYFRDNGYGGYLLYDMDKTTGEIKKSPGFHTVSGTKVNIFNYMIDEIETHAHRWEDIGLIEECLKIKDAEDMKNYDLFTAAAGCLLAERSEYARAMRVSMDINFDVSGFYG